MLPLWLWPLPAPASLRARLAVALAGAALPLMLAVTLLAARQLQTARAQVLAQQHAVAVALAQVVADYVGLHRAAVAALASQPGLAELSPEAQWALLGAVGASYPEFVALGAIDADGRPVAGLVRGAADPTGALPARSLYEAHRYTEPAVMVTTSPYTREPMFALGVPVPAAGAAGAGWWPGGSSRPAWTPSWPAPPGASVGWPTWWTMGGGCSPAMRRGPRPPSSTAPATPPSRPSWPAAPAPSATGPGATPSSPATPPSPG